MIRLLAYAAAILALSQSSSPSKVTAGMQTDVDRLVARAKEMDPVSMRTTLSETAIVIGMRYVPLKTSPHMEVYRRTPSDSFW